MDVVCKSFCSAEFSTARMLNDVEFIGELKSVIQINQAAFYNQADQIPVKGAFMYFKQLMASEIRRNSKKRRLQFKVLMRYLAVSIAFVAPLFFVGEAPTFTTSQSSAYTAF